ncbi:flagellar operon protein TIGR03826 [Proteiniborus ethanoligenes]|uniref:Flagellar operon protein TIGR03826 n=1 Tax=Proteiniborus ethanoligenes TaxID=415015 RepID=A0A1H3S5X9_9FIRM|nr:TIGR03826 family flagellar region protein [Proteiniborus ethanoligenes]SDZ32998.1 flagellar operon protein TIGR03826 [Proteiniborus ethanoligenes]
MAIRNCKKCGRIYADDNFELCPKCRTNEVDEFKKVKDYLYKYPGADIQVVSDETGVDTKKILKYLRDGKLEIKDDSPNLVLDCERCGTPIRTGRFCQKCVTEMQREFKSAVADNSPVKKSTTRDSDKMYIAERHKRR